MADVNLLGYLGVILTVLVVGVSLGGLVLKLHNDTNRRIDGIERRIEDTNRRLDELAIRISEMEKSVARLEGYMAGLQIVGTQASA